MKLAAKEVNVLKGYSGDYEGLNKRLEYDKPKTLRLSINEKDLLLYWLEDDNMLTDTEKSIKNKLLGKK